MNDPRTPSKDRLKKPKKTKEEVDRQLDEALEETFPTSDPVAITAPGGPVEPGEDPKKKRNPTDTK